MFFKTEINTKFEDIYHKILFKLLDKVDWRRKVADFNVLQNYRKELKEYGFSYEGNDDAQDYYESEDDYDDDEGDGLSDKEEENDDEESDTPKHFSWTKPTLSEIINVAMDDAQSYSDYNMPWTLINPHLVVADSLIPQDLKKNLLYEVSRLESTKPDYHPNTDSMVLDVLHPSLYCAVVGKTIFKGEDGNLEKFVLPEPGGVGIYDNYQWLPAEFEVLSDRKVKIHSYINNLHPVQFKPAYKVIAEVFEIFVPGFELALADMPDRFVLDTDHWRPVPKGKEIPKGYQRKHYRNRVEQIVYPALNPEYSPFPTISHPLASNLQVIVKIASIQLSPEKPRYNGGSWHLEGTDAESILATGIYYFDSDNITESRLSFRSLVDPPDYEQDDRRGVKEIYGIEDEDQLIRNLGSLTCHQDRLLVFKNDKQHLVEPFELVDKSRNGHRKILVFFLINPERKILSTKQVPFSNLNLMVDFLKVLFREKLPVEILEVIAEYAGAIGINEARKNRADLMEARSFANNCINEDEELYFSLCEH